MSFVLDASITLAWAFADEDEPRAMLALERLRRSSASVPSLWWTEIGNTLIVAERRGRMSVADTTSFLREIKQLGLITDRNGVIDDALALAREHRLTVYDACYLELALRDSIPLATLDGTLRAAARTMRVPLLDEIA
jgi:predicted nucleic acid-binding protein